jgi:hypothetical protein
MVALAAPTTGSSFGGNQGHARRSEKVAVLRAATPKQTSGFDHGICNGARDRGGGDDSEEEEKQLSMKGTSGGIMFFFLTARFRENGSAPPRLLFR